MKYKIADLVVEFEPKFEMLKARASKYQANENEKVNLRMLLNEEYLKKEEETTPELLEYIAFGTSFYKALVKFKGCLLHASAVVVEDEAYLFSAPCGTGKSTHTSLWMKYLANKNPYILNDDKPAIRIVKDEIYAYGTPFSGKYDMSENKRVKLKGICFLNQAKVNSIRKLDSDEAIKLFLEQTFNTLEKEDMLQFLNTLDEILNKIPVFELCCDMSKEAVELSYQTMKGESQNED